MAQPYHVDNDYLATLEDLLKNVKEKTMLKRIIVDAPFYDKKQTTLLGLGMMVLTIINHKLNIIERIAYSNTDAAKNAFGMSVKPFKDLSIPVSDDNNIIVKAIKLNKSQRTEDWSSLFTPVLTPEEARFIQAGAGTDCSIVYPLPGKISKGALIFSYYEQAQNIATEHDKFMNAYCSFAATALDQTS